MKSDLEKDVDLWLNLNKALKALKEQTEAEDEWKENNLEYDLRNTDWMLDKVRSSRTYAQHLYAALCNNEFRKLDVMPILTDQVWTCSWRYAGGILADMLNEGDYMDWYCSGIGDGLGNGDEDGSKGYVREGTVTDQLRDDLYQLKWIVVTKQEEEL